MIVSLCSGIGLLDVAAEELTGDRVGFHAELDPWACKTLEMHWAGSVNLGDVWTIDWTPFVGQVDVLVAGYPCQPMSSAGRRGGEDDERWLWPAVWRAIWALRPGLVLLENVSAHLSLGFDTVLASLAALGFDAEWTTLEASAVGACHKRDRLFIVASDPESDARWLINRDVLPTRRRVRAEGVSLLPTPAARDGKGGDVPTRGGGPSLPQSISLLPTPDAGNFNDSEDPDSWLDRRDVLKAKGINGNGAGMPLAVAAKLLPTPRTSDANGAGDHGTGGVDLRTALLPTARNQRDWRVVIRGKVVDYGPAIRRHEEVMGEPAPDPLVGRSLSADFVRWMMMAPKGWLPEMPRTAALRLLGNACLSSQALTAWQELSRRLQGRRQPVAGRDNPLLSPPAPATALGEP